MLGIDPDGRSDRLDDHYKHLRRGFNWLGSATVIAKLIDFGTIVTVLLFLTKDQVGVASLVVSIGMVVESMNGLGTGEALVQARDVSRLQLDTVFWFVIGLSLVIVCVILLLSPAVQMVYGIAGMTAYLAVIAVKQPIVGAALIPIALMNRALQYERIAVVNVIATFLAALTRLGLAVGGAGAWALVIGFAAHGLYTLIGAQVARPFRPSLQFRMYAISGLTHFGVRAAVNNALHQMFKNVDYLLIGWLYGPSQLAIYRVAFDIAMEPVMAVGMLVNRTSMPVFARVWENKAKLLGALQWSLGRLEILLMPLMAFFVMAADPLMTLLHDREGHSYAGAALPLKLLAIAAMLRVTLEVLYALMLASGRPGAAVRLSGSTLLLLSGGLLTAGFIYPAGTGVVAMSAVWLLIYPPLLFWGAHFLQHNWAIHISQLKNAMIVPLVGVAALTIVWAVGKPLIHNFNPEVQITCAAITAALTYLGMFVYLRKKSQNAETTM